MTDWREGKADSLVVMVFKTLSPIDDMIPIGRHPLATVNGTSRSGVREVSDQ